MPKEKEKILTDKGLTEKCKHDFRYSHLEHPTYPAIGSTGIFPRPRDVVVCKNCGLVRKQ